MAPQAPDARVNVYTPMTVVAEHPNPDGTITITYSVQLNVNRSANPPSDWYLSPANHVYCDIGYLSPRDGVITEVQQIEIAGLDPPDIWHSILLTVTPGIGAKPIQNVRFDFSNVDGRDGTAVVNFPIKFASPQQEQKSLKGMIESGGAKKI